mgnify:CR=1 FL=1
MISQQEIEDMFMTYDSDEVERFHNFLNRVYSNIDIPPTDNYQEFTNMDENFYRNLCKVLLKYNFILEKLIKQKK